MSTNAVQMRIIMDSDIFGFKPFWQWCQMYYCVSNTIKHSLMLKYQSCSLELAQIAHGNIHPTLLRQSNRCFSSARSQNKAMCGLDPHLGYRWKIITSNHNAHVQKHI